MGGNRRHAAQPVCFLVGLKPHAAQTFNDGRYDESMSFFSVFFALLLEQAHPLPRNNWVYTGTQGWMAWIRRSMDAGQRHHGLLVWGMAVGVPVLLVAVIHMLLHSFSIILTFLWAVGILYVTLGFRQFSHHFTVIRTALERGDQPAARAALAEWQGIALDAVPASDLPRQAIECAALAVHKHVLGVLVCFMVGWMLGFGPAGAVLFRLACYLAETCEPVSASTVDVLDGRYSSESVWRVTQDAWRWINHVPARATALAFAVVGNFEEAVANWRQESEAYPDANDGIVLAATAGALNLRLRTAAQSSAVDSSSSYQPQLPHLGSLVGLVWRSVVLWMLILALVTLARSIG